MRSVRERRVVRILLLRPPHPNKLTLRIYLALRASWRTSSLERPQLEADPRSSVVVDLAAVHVDANDLLRESGIGLRSRFSTKAAKLFFLFGGESPPVSGVDLGLVHPLLARRLGCDIQIAGGLRNGMLLVGGLDQQDGLFLEPRRIQPACLARLLRSLSPNLIA